MTSKKNSFNNLGSSTPRSIRELCVGWVVLFFAISGVLTLGHSSVYAYKPTDPKVQRMVDRGVKWLENFKGEQVDSGQQVLMAYAHFKVEHDETVEVVKKGIKAAVSIAKANVNAKNPSHKANYEIGVAILLLAAVNPQRFKPELEMLQSAIYHAQMNSGGFTYHNEKKGDISQIQYALLGIWTLDRAGIALDYQRVLSSLQFLLRTQDKNGPWPYHADDPGPNQPLKQQNKTSMSMALAGGSSLLIAGDALRLWGDTTDDDDPGIDGLPKAIKLYKEDKNRDRRRRVKISKEPVFRSINLMEAWRKKNPYKRTRSIDWYYYQLYTLERYESFVEIANGRPKDESPGWYNRGVDELAKFQDGDGGWTDRSHSPPHVSTAFAILFLIRSTQKAIFTVGSGNTVGGQGFGNDVKGARLVNGQSVAKKVSQSVNDMLDLLDGDNADALDGKSMADDFQLPNPKVDPKGHAAVLDRLERLVRGSQSWQARRVAAKVLGRSEEMRVVPSLIYALSDPDSSVKRYARDGLRFISRKFEGFGMPDKPEDSERREAQKKWRDWYRSMNPSYVFLDTDL